MSTSSSDGDFKEAIVLDNGSHKIFAGFAGDDAPRCVIDTVVGHSYNQRDCYVGDQAMQKREVSSLVSPIECGIVTNWDVMEKIWDHMFRQELRVPSEERGILVTEPPLNPKANREMMTQIMFETFNVPRMYVSLPAVLAFYANGRSTGLVLDIGETVTHVLSSYESTFFPEATRRIDFGGRDLNQHLQTMLIEREYTFSTSIELKEVRCMKEKLCFVNLKTCSKGGNPPTSEDSYTLPDGQIIKLSRERSLCPEALFNPSLTGCESKGVHELVHESLMCCGPDSRRDMIVNIMLSGGSTMFRGLAERMQQELETLFPMCQKLRVIAPPERRASVWIGGSVLASLSTFEDRWISKEQYEEYGPHIMHSCV